MTPQTGDPSRQRRADLLGLATVLCWSTVPTAFKLGLAHFTPAQLLLGASVISWLFLGVILAVRGRLTLALFAFRGANRFSVLLGALNPFLYYLVLIAAYDLLPAQEAQAINYTWALTMSLLAVPLLGHRLRRREVFAALISYSGVLVIATRGDLADLKFANLPGVVLALGSTLIWAFYWILGVRDDRDPVTALFLNFTAALPMIAIFCAMTGQFSGIVWKGVPAAIYVGIFEMGLSFVLWLKAMKLTAGTARIANLIFISPPLSLVFVALILHEPIYVSTLAGLVLILGGLAVQRMKKTEESSL